MKTIVELFALVKAGVYKNTLSAGSPFDKQGEVQVKDVVVDGKSASVTKSQFGESLMLTANGESQFVQFRRGTDTSKKSFDIIEFEASKDRSGTIQATNRPWAFKAGDKRLFAV